MDEAFLAKVKQGQEEAHVNIYAGSDLEGFASTDFIFDEEEKWGYYSSFKRDMDQIIYLLKDAEGLTNEDYRILKRLVKLMETNIKLGIFCTVIDNNADVSKILEDIDKSIEDGQSEISEIEEEISKKMIDFGSEKLRRLRKYVSNLEEIKEEIINKDFSSLAIALSNDIESGKELVDDCSVSLQKSFYQYGELFGYKTGEIDTEDEKVSFRINPDVIDKVFSIIADSELYSEIKKAVELREDYFRSTNELRELTAKIPLLQKIKNNFDIISEYLCLENGIECCRKEIEKAKDKLVNINNQLVIYNNSSFFDRLKNNSRAIQMSSDAQQLDNQISYYEDKLKDIQKRSDEAKAKLEKAGLSKVVERFERKLFIGPDKVLRYSVSGGLDIDDLIAQSTVKSYNDNGLSCINALISVNDDKISSIKETIRTSHDKFEEYKESMSTKALNLIRDEYETCVKLISLEKEAENYGRTPIICAFVLKTFVDSKRLEWDDIYKISNSEIVIEELSAEYERLIMAYLKPFRDRMERNEDLRRLY